jgi:hemoglobin-like flavoprotein
VEDSLFGFDYYSLLSVLMDCCKSKDAISEDGMSEDGGFDPGYVAQNGGQIVTIPLSAYTAEITHFTPAQFPVPAHLTNKIIDVCRKSWKKIFYGVNKERELFAEVFYGKLLKKSPRFADVFPSGPKGEIFKCDLLGKAINFLTSMRLDTCQDQLTKLGKYHNRLKIRPWMYSDYFSTIVETLNTVLGDKATYFLMEQWYQALSFISFYMLKGALPGNVIEGEVGVGSFEGPFEGDSRVALNRVVKLTG